MHHKEGKGKEKKGNEGVVKLVFIKCWSCDVWFTCPGVYHNLSKRAHLHDVLELLIHVSEGELTCSKVRGQS